jgi:hypothetical protein
MRHKMIEVKVGDKIGSQLNPDTGNYEPVYKTGPSGVANAVKITATSNKKVASGKKSNKKVAKTVKKTAVTVKAGDKRHEDVLKVLEKLGKKSYKKTDFMKTAETVLGYSIPFNKKVREHYSVKTKGSYKVAKEYRG